MKRPLRAFRQEGEKKILYSQFHLTYFTLISHGLQSCQEPPIISPRAAYTRAHAPRQTPAVKIKPQQLLTDSEHLASVNPPETSSPIRLHSLPAAFTCPGRVGLLRSHIATHRAATAGTFSGVSGGLGVSIGTGSFKRARLPPFITGRLPDRCLCRSRLILPSGRGSGALTSRHQSSRKLSTIHGLDTNPLEAAHTHSHTQVNTLPFFVPKLTCRTT